MASELLSSLWAPLVTWVGQKVIGCGLSLAQVSPTTLPISAYMPWGTCTGVQAYWKTPIYVTVIDLRNLFITT